MTSGGLERRDRDAIKARVKCVSGRCQPHGSFSTPGSARKSHDGAHRAHPGPAPRTDDLGLGAGSAADRSCRIVLSLPEWQAGIARSWRNPGSANRKPLNPLESSPPSAASRHDECMTRAASFDSSIPRAWRTTVGHSYSRGGTVSKRLMQAAVVVLVAFALAQLIRPSRANPPTDARRTIQAQMGTANGLVAVLDRSCGDCHSNRTVWPWYTQVAPLSWAMAYAVAEGRKVVNFSEWAGYSPEQQRQLLTASCQAASQGKMPGAYTLFRSDTRLSAQDIQTICAAVAQANAGASP